jgi:MoxR-like ATPase
MEQKIRLQNFVLNNSGKAYLPGKELTDAIEIAIALNKPLLVTGEPGTGKTKLAEWLAVTLADQTKNDAGAFRDAPFVFNTKSTSVASDLFYNYDAVSHFGNIQRNKDVKFTGEEEDNLTRRFIELKAMGLAIAQTHGTESSDLLGIRNYQGEKDKGPLANKPMSSVVLIDEIDKAPREFANDLLNEIESYSFEFKELNRKITRAENDCRIVTILTSNDEKTLPNAFLRRCIFYHIGFPSNDRLLQITKLKLGIPEKTRDFDKALNGAIAKFEELRRNVVNKRPSTAELLDWINILYQGRDDEGNNFLQGPNGELHPDADSPKNLSTLIKTFTDSDSVKN